MKWTNILLVLTAAAIVSVVTCHRRDLAHAADGFSQSLGPDPNLRRVAILALLVLAIVALARLHSWRKGSGRDEP